ncbi:MAG TPA: hypothetical protein VHL52_03290 [Acidimicrobiia bacterium]|nr:hypothetical protein [Acidimicrobiia bacterium]
MDIETVTERESRPRTRSRVPFIVTSALASAVGVIVAIFVDNLGQAVAGLIGDRAPVLYHNDVVFHSAGSDLALGGGVVLTLLAGAFFLTLYPGSRRFDASRLTMLWIILHCFRQGFTQLATLSLSDDSNVALAFGTLDVPVGLDLVVSAAGVVGLLSIALASAPAFLAYAHRQSLIDSPAKRAAFTGKLALVPGVVGPLLTVPAFLPDNGSGLIQSLPLLGLFTVATVLAALATRTVRIGDGRTVQGWSWLPLVWLVGFGLLFQLLLRRGLVIPPTLENPFVESG